MKKTVAMQMPQAWDAKPVKAATSVSARVDMSAEVAGKGLCPVCKQPMEEGFADGAPVRFCQQDLVTLPLSNAELVERGYGVETLPGDEENPDYSTWTDGNDTVGDAF